MAFAICAGKITRDGQPFIPVGVDYHPSRAGCLMWTQEWDAAAIRDDFLAMAAAGLNTVRLFVYWRDFEPEPGMYRDVSFARLRQAVVLADQAGLACVLSLLTIWMNGERLDLAWRQGGDLWRDPGMLTRQAEFARQAGQALTGLANLLAVDLGDEIANVDPAVAQALTRDEVIAWHRRLADVLRGCLPGTLVTQANDVSGVFGSSPFGPDSSEGLDLVAVHGFPTWSPGAIESTISYKATNLPAFLARFAGAYGTAFIDELGSYSVNEAGAAAYLRAAAASALGNGASGMLVWCWQDIASSQPPYRERPQERYAGLRRLDGQPKPALEALARIASAAPRIAGIHGHQAPIGLYVPERARTARSSYLDSGTGTVATFFAYLLLKRAHLDFEVVSGDLDGYRLVICPSVNHVTLTDLDRLHAHLDRGGYLYYSMGDALHGFPGTELAGAEIVDYSLLTAGKTSLAWDDAEWPVDWSAAAVTPATLAATSAVPAARYTDGTPAMVTHQAGRGEVLFCAAPFERQLDSPGRLTHRDWHAFYRRIAARAGIWPLVDCEDPEIEIVASELEGAATALVVNHGAAAASSELAWRDAAGQIRARVPVTVGAKDWRIVAPGN